MIHLQAPVNNWLEAVRLLPDKSVVKAVDNVQSFKEVKAINPNISTCLRHHYDHAQVFGGTFEENKQRAREFFSTFVDGTFIEYARYVDYIEEWNEYLANSQNELEIDDRVTWAEAAAWVWKNEYRTRQELKHIRLVLCNTAIGNWIDKEFAIVANHYDAVIGYHPYTLWENGVRWEGDWVYLSGLWDTMEYDWGVDVDWIFTEAGPFNSVVGGWRESTCLGGDRDKYVAAVREWIHDVRQTPAFKEGRVKGFCLFTTGRAGDTWKKYWTEQPELNELATMTKSEWIVPSNPQPPDPEPPDPEPIPPAKYKIVVNLLSQIATIDDKFYVIEQIHDSKETMMQSADDAINLVNMGQPGSKVKAWNPQEWSGDIVKYLEDRGVENVELHYTPKEGYIIEDIVNDLPKSDTLTYDTRPPDAITTLTIHHTVSPADRPIEQIAAYHVDGKGWPGIGYHFVIDDMGNIYQTNYLETKSYHAGSYNAPGDENYWSVGIALQGDFTNNEPPQEQLDATRWLVSELKDILGELYVIPHRHMPGASTQCPGNTWEDWFSYIEN